ncbi:PREDICTED: atrophin-1-like [Wasmannia auropunctata]|uniref:atrophin-1-like n=1 Tax=Wasmannia auropunctata TaxID=64793 RepID=UPI0005ED691B|nr:PREDICTED: atrophin-1-like [Wasmannia auropunctata]
MNLKMRLLLVIHVLALVLSLTQAKQKVKVQKPEVTKLEVVNLGEVQVKSDLKQSNVEAIQRKRDSGYAYNKPHRVSSSARLRIQTHPSRSQIAFKIPGQLSRPFMKYGPPQTHSTSDPAAHGYHAEQHQNKLQYDVGQQQSIGFGGTGLAEQEVPSPIRNVDFTEMNPIASQNNVPFGMHTANYLPPRNQQLPAYSSTNSFEPQSFPNQGQIRGTSSQNFVQTQVNQISDAAVFLSENAQAIQQLYGAPASHQDFAPGNEHFHGIGNQIHNPSDQFESTSQNPEEFRGTLPSYASGTLGPRETLEQIQALEKDRLIVQLQQALAQAQNSVGRYAQNQAGFVQSQELLASISQQVNSRVPATPQSAAFASGNTAFSQSTLLPGTTVNPLRLPVNYGIPTTTQTPTTTTVAAGVFTTQPPSQSSEGDSTAQVVSSPSNQPGSSVTGSPAGIPVYGGFVPSFITGTNFPPSYSTGILASGSFRPETSPTHFGIPIPTEPPHQKPVSGLAPSIPATTTTPLSPVPPPSRPGIALTPAAITPVALPIQPIRPVAPLATPLHPIAAPLLPGNPAQVHPAGPVTSTSVQHTYGHVQTALLNPLLYKPVKAVYPVYYYPVNVAYQLQKPASPSYPWNYAPLYATQTAPAKIWK